MRIVTLVILKMKGENFVTQLHEIGGSFSFWRKTALY